MKTRYTLGFVMAALLSLGMVRNVAAQAHIFELNLAGSVATSEALGDEQVVAKGKLTTDKVINVALGRSESSTVATNEKLVLIVFFTDDPIALLSVYDTNTSTILTNLAELSVSGAIDSAKGKGVIAMAGPLESAGNLLGGWIAMTGKVTISGENTPTPDLSFNAAVQAVFRVQDGDEQPDVICTKAKANIVKRLGAFLLY